MKPPLLLIGHGAHDDTGAAEFGRFVHRLRCRLDQLVADVSGGFVAKGRPSLSDSVASLVARGHHRLVAIPLTLGDSEDVPAAIARARVAHPILTCDRGRALGASPQVLALMAERLADALAEMPRLASVSMTEEHGEAPWEPVTPAETAVVLVGHGSSDTGANAEVHRVSRLFWETHAPELLTVETAYVADAPPSVAQGIERCRRLGAKRVVVLPYLLFAGGVLERIWAEALAYAAGHIDLDVRCAEVIGDCEGLADLIIERYEEVLEATDASLRRPGPDVADSEDEILGAADLWPLEDAEERVLGIAEPLVSGQAGDELLERVGEQLSLDGIGSLDGSGQDVRVGSLDEGGQDVREGAQGVRVGSPQEGGQDVVRVGRPAVRMLPLDEAAMVDGLV
ncbi:sirohydrochlorin chelatase [Sphaerisporangium sp. NPDC049002]|uniref:sirohydrochlorin chelatase n=1 Tax=unclassified Sphaerisporangium TaxID=2630420 RepID=UPI003409AA3A